MKWKHESDPKRLLPTLTWIDYSAWVNRLFEPIVDVAWVKTVHGGLRHYR